MASYNLNFIIMHVIDTSLGVTSHIRQLVSWNSLWTNSIFWIFDWSENWFYKFWGTAAPSRYWFFRTLPCKRITKILEPWKAFLLHLKSTNKSIVLAVKILDFQEIFSSQFKKSEDIEDSIIGLQLKNVILK